MLLILILLLTTFTLNFRYFINLNYLSQYFSYLKMLFLKFEIFISAIITIDTSLNITNSSIINIINSNKDLNSSFIDDKIVFRLSYCIFTYSLDIIYNNKGYYSIVISYMDYFKNSYIFKNFSIVFTVAFTNGHFHHCHPLQLFYFQLNLIIILYFSICYHRTFLLLL